MLSGYTFLPLSEQVKPEWLGGGLSDVLKSTAEFLKEAGRIDSVGEDYAPFMPRLREQAAAAEAENKENAVEVQ